MVQKLIEDDGIDILSDKVDNIAKKILDTNLLFLFRKLKKKVANLNIRFNNTEEKIKELEDIVKLSVDEAREKFESYDDMLQELLLDKVPCTKFTNDDALNAKISAYFDRDKKIKDVHTACTGNHLPRNENYPDKFATRPSGELCGNCFGSVYTRIFNENPPKKDSLTYHCQCPESQFYNKAVESLGWCTKWGKSFYKQLPPIDAITSIELFAKNLTDNTEETEIIDV